MLKLSKLKEIKFLKFNYINIKLKMFEEYGPSVWHLKEFIFNLFPEWIMGQVIVDIFIHNNEWKHLV